MLEDLILNNSSVVIVYYFKMASTKQEEAPWHAAFPPPKTAVSTISRSDFLGLIKAGKKPGKDFILVDLRRNDHEVSRLIFH